jgi:hypothetical protein
MELMVTLPSGARGLWCASSWCNRGWPAVGTGEHACSRLAHAEDRERLAIGYVQSAIPTTTDEAATHVDPSPLHAIGTTA